MHRLYNDTWANLLLLMVLVIALTHAPLVTAESLWVSFNSASSSPSTLRQAAMRARGEVAEIDPGTPIRGLLAIPAGKGPFPAVVLTHDCLGVRQFQREWVRKLANWGYVALLVGSFYSRNAADVCSQVLDWYGHDVISGRVFDAYGALEYLAGLKQVDINRVGLISWDRDTGLSTVNEHGFQAQARYRFTAAVAVTPSCRHSTRGRFSVPILLLAGGQDDWTLLDACERMVARSQETSHPVTMKVYPQAWHGFDDPLVRSGTFLKSAYNPTRQPSVGATLRYNREAHEDSITSIQKFLQHHLRPTPPVGLGQQIHDGTWVVDPHQVGPDLPPQGRSLFDRLFTRQGKDGPQYDVPFPISRVLDRIRSQLGAKPVAIGSGYGPGSDSGMQKILIPLGRSLQRFAAAPNFFESPRVVVAVDGEPQEVLSGQHPLRLNDRLFLGYQEQAKVLEVISYNEQASRFEFQVVDDYAEGLIPKVYYANRQVCRSCHQNGSPIFSKAGWNETNGSNLISERLGEVSKDFYGLGYRSGTVGPAAVDNATDRANLFSVNQLLWRESCGRDSSEARRCRSAAIIAMLQQRLSASTGFDRNSERYQKDYLLAAKSHWNRLWSSGLLVPNPNIPDREPLLNEAPASIPAELDPLRLRPPLDVLKVEESKDVEQMITGLAEDLPAADMMRLDKELFTRGILDPQTHRYHIDADCNVTRRGSPGKSNQIQVECDAGPGGMKLQAGFPLQGNQIREGYVRRIEFDANTYYAEMDILAGHFQKQGQRWVADLQIRHRGSNRHVRLATGHALVILRLSWPADPETKIALPVANAFPASVDAVIMDDFSSVITAVESLRDAPKSTQGLDVLGAQRFDAIELVKAVMPALGLKASSWCCDTPQPLPPALAHSEITTDGAFKNNLAEHGALSAFIRNCSSCHRTQMTLPPNFLMGDQAAVKSNIAHCAQRIYVRLSMWELAEDERPKSPMPPQHSLKAYNQSQSKWRASRDLATLKTYVAQILKREQGEVPSVKSLLHDGYDATRSCLDVQLAGAKPALN